MYQGFFVLIHNNFGFLGCSQLIEGISWLFLFHVEQYLKITAVVKTKQLINIKILQHE